LTEDYSGLNDEQLPNRVYAYNNRLSGDRSVGSTAVPGTGAVNVSPERLDDLRRQVGSQLRPVLRPREFDRFDVDRAFGIVRRLAESLG
jgi:hypothetical protein